MSDFCATSFPRARKAHACAECQRDVAPGERYARVAGAVDGRPYVDRYCLACHALAVAAWATVAGGEDAGPAVGSLADWIAENDVAHWPPPAEQGHYHGLQERAAGTR